MSELELARRHGMGSGGELVDAFEARAMGGRRVRRGTEHRRAYATSYRASAAFLRACYGEASVDTFTVAAVAAWSGSLTRQHRG